MRLLIATHRWAGVFVVVGSIWLFSRIQAAPITTDADSKAKLEHPADKIRRALERTITLDYVNQPFSQVVTHLRDQSKINIFVDRLAIQQMGMDPEVLCSIKLENVKLSSALRILLSQMNLGYAIVGEVLMITTEPMANYRQVSQRVSINVDAIPLKTALQQLARDTATNLVVDARVSKEAQTPISLNVDDVSLDTAVRLLAESADLKVVQTGNVLFVTSEVRAAKMRAENDGNNIIPAALPMGAAQPPAINAIPQPLPAALPAAPPLPPPPAPAERLPAVERR